MDVVLVLALLWLVVPLPLGLVVGSCLRWARDGRPVEAPVAAPVPLALADAA